MADAMLLGLKGRRILVVEDEYLLAGEMASLLSAHGAEVLGPVPTVLQARRLLTQRGYPDVAILDVNLGGEFVWPVVDLLRTAGVPIVLATGYDQDVINAQYGQLPRCEKPASPHEVLGLLKRVLMDAESDQVHPAPA